MSAFTTERNLHLTSALPRSRLRARSMPLPVAEQCGHGVGVIAADVREHHDRPPLLSRWGIPFRAAHRRPARGEYEGGQAAGGGTCFALTGCSLGLREVLSSEASPGCLAGVDLGRLLAGESDAGDRRGRHAAMPISAAVVQAPGIGSYARCGCLWLALGRRRRFQAGTRRCGRTVKLIALDVSLR